MDKPKIPLKEYANINPDIKLCVYTHDFSEQWKPIIKRMILEDNLEVDILRKVFIDDETGEIDGDKFLYGDNDMLGYSVQVFMTGNDFIKWSDFFFGLEGKPELEVDKVQKVDTNDNVFNQEFSNILVKDTPSLDDWMSFHNNLLWEDKREVDVSRRLLIDEKTGEIHLDKFKDNHFTIRFWDASGEFNLDKDFILEMAKKEEIFLGDMVADIANWLDEEFDDRMTNGNLY